MKGVADVTLDDVDAFDISKECTTACQGLETGGGGGQDAGSGKGKKQARMTDFMQQAAQ